MRKKEGTQVQGSGRSAAAALAQSLGGVRRTIRNRGLYQQRQYQSGQKPGRIQRSTPGSAGTAVMLHTPAPVTAIHEPLKDGFVSAHRGRASTKVRFIRHSGGTKGKQHPSWGHGSAGLLPKKAASSHFTSRLCPSPPSSTRLGKQRKKNKNKTNKKMQKEMA